MRWALAALGLTAALVASVAWVAVRDWQREDALDDQHTQALHHAEQLLRLGQGGTPCADCWAEVVGPLREDLWRVAVVTPQRRSCFDVDNDRFALRPGGGVDGVRAVDCPTT